MATLEKYLDRLKKRRIEFAVQAVKSPGALTAANLGYIKGRGDGLEEAEKLVEEVLHEEEKGALKK